MWECTPWVESKKRATDRLLNLALPENEVYEMSWLGLIQAASAAKKLECDYLWLDLVCLNQLSREDKRLQIDNMANIYKNAKCVIVMFGGCAAAQPLDQDSVWINRAWTLQEATLNSSTWGLFEGEFPGDDPEPSLSFERGLGGRSPNIPLLRAQYQNLYLF